MADAFRELVSLTDPDPGWLDRYAEEAQADRARSRGLPPGGRAHGRQPGGAAARSRSSTSRSRSLRAMSRARSKPSPGSATSTTATAALPAGEYMTKRPARGSAVNAHVFAAGNSLLDDNRMIRDYLRAHPDAAREYERVKQLAVDRGHVDLRSYSQAKGEHVARSRPRSRLRLDPWVPGVQRFPSRGSGCRSTGRRT